MIKLICERCQKEFSNETNYEQHSFFEEQKELLKQLAEGNTSSFNLIYSQLNMLVLLNIIKEYDLKEDFEEAAKVYFRMNDAWNKVVNNRREFRKPR